MNGSPAQQGRVSRLEPKWLVACKSTVCTPSERPAIHEACAEPSPVLRTHTREGTELQVSGHWAKAQ